MKINEQFLINNLPNILKQFEQNSFKMYSISEKEKIISNFVDIIINSFNIKANNYKIAFVDKNVLEEAGALFNFYDNTFLFNNYFLNNNISLTDIALLLDNIIHEPIHYCQKQNKLYLDFLETPLPFPYKIFQPNEIDAYDTTEKILNICKNFLSENLCVELDKIINAKTYLKAIALLDLNERGYKTESNSIDEQIKDIVPFYKNIYLIQYLENNNALKITINKNKQNVKATFYNGIFCGYIEIKNKNFVDKLHFSFTDNTCFINDITGITQNNIFIPVRNKNKEKLIDILNKIIKSGNELNVFTCKQLEINPISLTDNKKDYDKFIEDVKTGNIKIPLIFNNNISEKQIKEELFNER